MRANEVLRPGVSLLATNNQYRLTMQGDGNLVLAVASSGRPVWSAQTQGHPGAWAVMQADGNFVVYDASNVALWASGTDGHPGAWFAVQGDSNLVVYDPTNLPLWNKGLTNGLLASNEILTPNQFLRSINGVYRLTMQGDGNLVMTIESSSAPIWSTQTQGHPGAWAVMQGDGNFVVYDATNVALWASGTDGHPSAWLAVQGDSNLVVYAPDGRALWAKGISGGGGGQPVGDDYPANLKNLPKDAVFDPWRFYNRECTSFVAWRMNSRNGIAFSNFMNCGKWGNADNWDDNARGLGFPVNSTPAVGAIAQWNPGEQSSGHVAWVAAVNPDGSVVVEEYNHFNDGTYSRRTLRAPRYIHVKDI